MSEDIVQIQDLIRIARRNLVPTLAVALGFGLIGIGAAFIVPKKFKSTAVLSIQASYFQIPFVSDLFSNTNDPSELRSQREALLRQALSDEFVDSIAEKHGLYKTKPGDPKRSAEREGFLKSIQFFSTGATTYQVSGNAGTAKDSLEIAESVLNQMVSTLVSARLDRLTRTRDAIEANLKELGVTISSGGGADPATLGQLHEDLAKAEGDLAAIEARFTPQHPSVLAQRRKVEALRARLNTSGSKQASKRVSDDAVNAGSRRALQDMTDELVRKLNYLNVALQMEQTTELPPYLSILEKPTLPASPLFPKKRLFLAGGLALGFLLGLVFAIFRELKRGTFLSPARAAQQLEVPFLGVMPTWNTAEARILIGSSTAPRATQRISVHEPENG